VEEIREALAQEGLGRRTNGGEFEIAESYRRTTNRKGEKVERLRVGTVDAFQGKEFDVVLLSVTRSNNLPGTTDDELRKKYGHLLLENRLCVAMSRQHRLLIAVGDLAFAREAKPIAALGEFLKLCEGPHGIILH
jgi:superfamily I DNA and/or RNA helicase